MLEPQVQIVNGKEPKPILEYIRKEKEMKKQYRAAAGIALLLLALSGILYYGRNADRAGEPREEQAEDTYQLVMQWPGVGEKPEGLADVEDAVNQITEAKIGVSVQLEYIKSADLAFQTSLDLESGKKLDLCVSIGGGMSRLVNAGYLMALDTMMDRYGQTLENVCGVQMTGGYYQGHLYGIPVVYTDGYQYGFICRRDLLKKYGFELQKDHYYTMDELESLFRQVKEGEGEDFYIFAGNTATTGDILFASQYRVDSLGASENSGVLLLDEDPETVVDLYETEAYRQYARRMYRWRQEGFFMPEAEVTHEDPNVGLANGNVFGRFFYNVPGDEVDNSVSSGQEVSFIPTLEACRMTRAYQTVLWSIPENCEDPQKVIEFLTLLYTDEKLVNLLQRGIEGVSYAVREQTESGKVIEPPKGEDFDTIPYYTVYGIYGNRLQVYPWAPADPDQNRIIREFSDSIRLESPALGYVFDSESVMVELSKIDEIVSKYEGIINTGLIDPDIELPMLVEELKTAGMDRVISENQRQYDLWRNQNAG